MASTGSKARAGSVLRAWALTPRSALTPWLVGLLGLAPALALAQTTAPTDAPAPTPAATGSAAPAASASAAPVVPATGYGWSTKPRKRGTAAPHRAWTARANSPDVILPGFETLGDGSTRLFVQLSQPVQFEAKSAPGTLTYVLKGAHVDRRNNTNPLVTVHFNTPVSSARLVPNGRDLWFVVNLRANVTPAVTMDAAKDGGAMLRIEFPRGDYLPGRSTAVPPPPSASPAAAPTPAAPSSR